ncbi:MAG: hypothetical protein N3C60_03160 [Calditerrivibrio sp.]|nr:hypothetical protein [Calditerrivibrio sp.]
MNRKHRLAIYMVLLMIFPSIIQAEWKGFKGSGGWGMNSPFNRMFDPNKIETVFGTVEKIDITTPHKMMSHGVYIVLKSDKGLLDIHLGPQWYIERLDFDLKAGDQIEVKGTPIMMMGKPSIIAAEIKKGEELLILRDINGIPVWSRFGGKRR